ncbi:CYTH domain-containing protein [Leptolyngbya iicbica]|uniref:CYTH domain-containing protein n=2 Tax=Cyanophyceae TaxID=3028117 RepID=A0A4Q7E8H1_9CYAN|nr:CYTH domain-containing protein [Leptolyngbya sp. LK]RZM78773.1 CYTH domain-containing protein [Leptolyngbya sp. LK]
MAQEIERKFLVTDVAWRQYAKGTLYRQGYVPTQNGTTVRARVVGDRGYLTIKGPTNGVSRQEFEYHIPLADAETMLADLCQPPLIEKWRYRINVGSHLWEIDEFLGDNAGLVMAEVELESETEIFDLPPWAGAEVSHDARYYNSNLAKTPYRSWPKEISATDVSCPE